LDGILANIPQKDAAISVVMTQIQFGLSLKQGNIHYWRYKMTTIMMMAGNDNGGSNDKTCNDKLVLTALFVTLSSHQIKLKDRQSTHSSHDSFFLSDKCGKTGKFKCTLFFLLLY